MKIELDKEELRVLIDSIHNEPEIPTEDFKIFQRVYKRLEKEYEDAQVEACSFCEISVDPEKPETFLIRDGVTGDMVCPACYSEVG